MASETNYIRIPLNLAEKRQLEFVSSHYEMYKADVIKALIKKEALSISRKTKE